VTSGGKSWRVKGPFHDAMQVKLAQLARTRSNEVISLDFETIAVQFLDEPSPGAASSPRGGRAARREACGFTKSKHSPRDVEQG